MMWGLLKRGLLETDKRLLGKLVWNLGIRGLRAIQLHKRRLRRGEFFPPYLYISIINSCNLRCQGCWVDVAARQQTLDVPTLQRVIGQAKRMGNSFFGLLGGEPLMHKGLFEVLEAHPDAYFQLFTNGHFITREVAQRLRRCGNVTPLISVEGSELVSDERRGRAGVWSATMRGLQHCLDARLLTGVCTSVCQTNFADLVNPRWVDRLIEMGVLYTWFHIYRPVGPQACPELMLTPQQQRAVRQFVVDVRCRKPIVVIDAYYDADGQALCPSAIGFTHHINPWGGIEPCPIIQFSAESVHDPRPLAEVFQQSEFLRDYRRLAASATRGCIALERPDLLEQLVAAHGAADATARGTALAELRSTVRARSQYSPDTPPIPERSWLYRLVKRIAFHDYGVYARHFRPEQWVDPNQPLASMTDRPPAELFALTAPRR